MATQAVTSGGPRNDGGTIKAAGTVAGTRFENKDHESVGRQVNVPVNSSNVGTTKPLTSGTFGYDTKYGTDRGTVLAVGANTKISGVASSLLTSPTAHIPGAPPYATSRGNYRWHRTSWDYVTGALTKGGNAGDLFTFIDAEAGGALAHEAFPTDAVPGKLVYRDGSFNPVQDTYSPRYS